MVAACPSLLRRLPGTLQALNRSTQLLWQTLCITTRLCREQWPSASRTLVLVAIDFACSLNAVRPLWLQSISTEPFFSLQIICIPPPRLRLDARVHVLPLYGKRGCEVHLGQSVLYHKYAGSQVEPHGSKACLFSSSSRENTPRHHASISGLR